MAAKTVKTAFTAATLATECETDARTLRKFLRSKDSGIDPVGKGARYSLEFTPTQLGKVKKNFADWTAAAKTAKAARDEDKAAKALNVLTSTPASRGVDEIDEDEIDFENMTDEEIDNWADDAVITNALAELDAEDTDEA